MFGISLIFIFIGAIVLSVWLTSFTKSAVAAILISLAVLLGMLMVFYFSFTIAFLGFAL